MTDDLIDRLAGWEHSLANEESEMVLAAIEEITQLRADARLMAQTLSRIRGVEIVMAAPADVPYQQVEDTIERHLEAGRA